MWTYAHVSKNQRLGLEQIQRLLFSWYAKNIFEVGDVSTCLSGESTSGQSFLSLDNDIADLRYIRASSACKSAHLELYLRYFKKSSKTVV